MGIEAVADMKILGAVFLLLLLTTCDDARSQEAEQDQKPIWQAEGGTIRVYRMGRGLNPPCFIAVRQTAIAIACAT